jgi:hypothetical protein
MRSSMAALLRRIPRASGCGGRTRFLQERVYVTQAGMPCLGLAS